MATKAQKVRLSIFLIVSTSVLLVFFIILVGNRLLERMDTYYIVYEDISVTGLDIGATVKFHGVQVGRVTGLGVKDSASIIVEIEVERGTPIQSDTEAILTMVGITGMKFVELFGGSPEAEMLPVGGSIIAGKSSFEIISGRAEVILLKVEQVLNNLYVMTGPETTASLQKTLTSISSVSSEIDTLLKGNRTSISNAAQDLEIIMSNLASATDTFDSSMTAFNALLGSRQVANTIDNMELISETLRTGLDSAYIADTAKEFRLLLGSADRLVINYDLIATRARDDILRSLRNLEEALDNLREATDVIRENPSVLIRGRRSTGDRVE